MDGNLRASAIGFVAAIAVLAVIFFLVGFDSMVLAVSHAEPEVVAVLPVVMAVWLTAWGLALRVVLGVLDSPVSVWRAVTIYTAATFANNVTPFGQAGGEPVTAYLIAETTGNEYESGLAAIASVDALNFVPSISLAALGLGYFGVTATLGRQLRFAAVAIGALTLAILGALYLIWQYSERVEYAVARAVTPVARLVSRPLPGREGPTTESVLVRVQGFFFAVERVAANRRGVASALFFSTVGWTALSVSLWLSLYSVGHQVPFAATLLVIPIASIASITPLPGGLGGIETVLIVLLVPTTSVDPVTAGAAVVIHRSVTYWLPTVLGAGVAAAFGIERFGF